MEERHPASPLSQGTPKGDGKGVGRGGADASVGMGARMQGAYVREPAGQAKQLPCSLLAKQGDLARRGAEPLPAGLCRSRGVC